VSSEPTPVNVSSLLLLSDLENVTGHQVLLSLLSLDFLLPLTGSLPVFVFPNHFALGK
jgi:hypothetical protein